MSIILKSSNSPHLAMVLEQLAKSGELDEDTAKKILVTFQTAVSSQGATEIGFEREPGQSFNPRAARILLILLKDAKVLSEQLLILAAESAGQGQDYEGYKFVKEPAIVSAAFLLDRLRHLHLEKTANREEIYAACIKAKGLVSSEFPEMAFLLEKGVERMRRIIGS